MIAADKLTKVFGDKVAVDGLTFEVDKGEILGFLGPNAAGKTTTMRMLTGYFPPTSGTARIAGHDVSDESIDVRRNVGYLPEHVPLYHEMTPYEFLTFAAAAKGIPGGERDKAVKLALGRCNLGPVENQLIGTISRGFKQRVGLAQAIVNNPKVLILDEPTVGLDPAQIRDIRELIRELAESSTVILSTHILPEVSATCSRVIIIAEGKIKAIDTPRNLTSSLQGMARILVRVGTDSDKVPSVLGAVEGINEVRRVEGNLYEVESDTGVDVRAELARTVIAQEWDLLELTPQSLSLEDIFLKIVRKEAS
ncbi:MAG: ATP-binding cassette domain-containing protein [Candidatus Eremiobacteraeota bacterium]|nr:ATP-binding cassette domain-containing protein [Candidatus Eremiobacteraeota bacterium]